MTNRIDYIDTWTSGRPKAILEKPDGPGIRLSLPKEAPEEAIPSVIDTLAGSSLKQKHHEIPKPMTEISYSQSTINTSMKRNLRKLKYQHLKQKSKVDPIDVGVEESMQLHEEGLIMRQK